MITAMRAAAMTLNAKPHSLSATGFVICNLIAIQAAIALLPSSVLVDAFITLAFVPARISFLFSPDAYPRAFESGVALGVGESDVALLLGDGTLGYWTLITYALLHGGWTHLTLNCVTLAVFGAPLERRFGSNRFLAFLAIAAVCGALAYYFVRPLDIRPVIGASGAVSAAMAASARFAFAPGGPLGGPRFASVRGAAMGRARTTALSHMFTNRRAIAFLGLLFGVTWLSQMFPQAAGASSRTAWEAHLGGFLAGLLLFDFFDPSQKGKDQEPLSS